MTSVDTWDVDPSIIRNRVASTGVASVADVLTLCDALEQLRAWNSQVAETLLSRQEEKDFEIIRLSRTNRTLLKELGELEVECAKHKAQAEASARLAADLVCERDSLLPQAGPTDSP